MTDGDNAAAPLPKRDRRKLRKGKKPAPAKIHLLTLADLDARTRAARNAVSLRDGLVSDLGGEDHATIAMRELAQRAAISGAMLEDAEARWLRGEQIEVGEYATLVNCQRRVLNDLGLERRARDVTPQLASYIEHRGAEKRADGRSDEATASDTSEDRNGGERSTSRRSRDADDAEVEP